MNAELDHYQLADCYGRGEGRVFLTGTQALVRILLRQHQMDARDGLNSAGFVTGYRGSPLGGVDMALWRAKAELDAAKIKFLPAINEELGATAVLGTQQVERDPKRTVDGVYSMWYGKGPGVDRAADALKHGNGYGSSPHGGVLVVAGDDHGCVSSSMSHQSDVSFMAWFMPTIHPANIEEYEEFGLWGYALSRFSGMWVGFKAISEVVEGASSVTSKPLPVFKTPDDFTAPPEGLHYRWPDYPGPQIEARMVPKIEATLAFARANPLDRCLYNVAGARFGIVTTGKGHLDLMEALRYLGLDEARCRELGIDVYKVGMVWPLETQGVSAFMAGKEEVLVVEEKRGIIESQLKEYIYGHKGDLPGRIVGKFDQDDNPLITRNLELSPAMLAPILAARLTAVFPDLNFDATLESLASRGVDAHDPGGVARMPYFCSGCPHNRSTKLPDGSEGLAGIGCHFMANWMERDTEGLIQMGGEGINWVGKAGYLKTEHVFQNLGDGTYYHSGSLAIRQAIAAGVNVTYKILFNDAVAMTGGQPVDGVLSVPAIAHQVRGEGVKRIAIVADDPSKYTDLSILPADVSVHHRDELDNVQRDLRTVKGVSVLIYDQECATEKRRKRKRGIYETPTKRLFINPAVCEGCGDCSVQSNCLSVVPKETPFGRKRMIDQHSCNMDYSCANGFCPSFVTIEGAALKKREGVDAGGLEAKLKDIPLPVVSALDTPYDMLVSGVGGTGVVTLGALVTMAAHLEGKGASVLDFMGFAQKGGAVLSYVRLGKTPEILHQVRTDVGQADALVACDLVVATSDKALSVLRNGRTDAVVNTTEIPTADYVLRRDADMGAAARVDLLAKAVGEKALDRLPANALADSLMGDTIFTNVMILGYAWQQGLVPVGLDAMMRAIELNGVAIDANKRAFGWGRLAAADLDHVLEAAGIKEKRGEETLDQIIARRADFLRDYQDAAYSARYVALTDKVKATGHDGFARAVAKNAFKLMAYKDEYEVARLHTKTGLKAKLDDTFAAGYRIKYNLAPPLLAWRKDPSGRPAKMEFGAWMTSVFAILARLKGLRGTALDIFGYTAERRMERRLRDDYLADMDMLIEQGLAKDAEAALLLANLPADIRGFGPVKETAVKVADKQRKELLARF